MNPLSFNYYVCPETVRLPEFADMAARAGASAIGLTVRAITEMDLKGIRALLASHGLKVSSLNSAGYFLYGDAGRAREQEELNTRLIATAAELQAQTLVVITGGIGHGSWQLADARARINQGLLRLAGRAASENVFLGIEPIHPLGILQKGCINSISDGIAIAQAHEHLGLTLDFFHSWWDPQFGSVFEHALHKVRLVQFCNVIAPDNPAEFHRELPGNGFIDVANALRGAHASGYRGYFEFEMFPEHLRGRAVADVVAMVGRQYAEIGGSKR